MKREKSRTRGPRLWRGAERAEFRTALEEALKSSGLLKQARTSRLCYDILELIRSCYQFPREVEPLVAAVKKADKNSTALYEETSIIEGALEHFRYHISHALSPIRALGMKAREMPPVSSKSDLQLSEEFINESLSYMYSLRPKQGKSKRSSKQKSGRSGEGSRPLQKSRAKSRKKAKAKRPRKRQ
jgi:hypothetical protein